MFDVIEGGSERANLSPSDGIRDRPVDVVLGVGQVPLAGQVADRNQQLRDPGQ
jgi:hypothetical protein